MRPVIVNKNNDRKCCLRYYLGTLTKSRFTNLTIGCIALISFISVRFASYKMNHTEWALAPINFIERECPKPKYKVAEQVDPSRICLTTLTDAEKADRYQRLVRWRNFNNLLDMTWPNKRSYVEKHGYQLFNESKHLDTSRPPSWSKIVAVRRLLQEESCDWVFWLDADTVIMESDIKIESFLPADYDMLITPQKGGSYNAGAWIVKNTEWSRQFLEHWWDKSEFVHPKGMSTSGDNDALKHYLTVEMDPQEFQQHIAVPARCTFNSVAVFLSPKDAELMSAEDAKKQFWYKSLEFYHKGDFIAHVAGKNNKITTSAMLLRDAK